MSTHQSPTASVTTTKQQSTLISNQAMGGASTDTMVLYAPFLNLFGIFLTVALCLGFLILSGITLKMMKVMSLKIRVILDKAQNSDARNEEVGPSSRINIYEESVKEKLEQLEKMTFGSFYRQLSWKYNFFSFYYPFYRARWTLTPQALSYQPDLLRPILQFHILQLLTSGFVSWIQSVFFTTLVQATYHQSTVPNPQADNYMVTLARQYRPDNEQGAMAGLTFCAVVISTLINMLLMHRVYTRIYMQTLRIAFSQFGEGKKYDDWRSEAVDKEDKEYIDFSRDRMKIPEWDGDNKKYLVAHFFQQNNEMRPEDATLQKVHPIPLQTMIDGPQLSSRMDMTTQIIDSTRQLIVPQDDQENNPRQQQLKNGEIGNEPHDQIKIEQEKTEPQFEDSDRVLFLEDLHHPGDIELLKQEALYSSNTKLVANFTLMFLTFTLISAISCFLNYRLDQDQSVNAFIMFCCAFLGDHFIFRPLILALLAFIRLLQARQKKKGQNDQKTLILEQSSRKELQSMTTQLNLDNLATDEEKPFRPYLNKDLLKSLKQGQEFEEIQRFNIILINHVKMAYGERGIKVLDSFRQESQKVLRKHYLNPVFNPIYDYNNEKLDENAKLKAGASVTSGHRTEPVKINAKDKAVHNSLIPGRTTKALNNLSKYKGILKDQKLAPQYNTLNKDKKAYFESIKHNLSMNQSQRSEKEDSIIKKRSRHASPLKGSVALSLKPDQNVISETMERRDSGDDSTEELKVIQDLEVKIFEIGNSCDENGISPSQKVSLTQLRLQKAKIQKLAAQRKAQKEQMNAEAQRRLEELNEELEQYELENLSSNLDNLTVEQRERLNQLRLKKLNKLRTMINQKNPINLTYDEALQLKELIDYFKVPLSPLEQHRMNQQLKRHNLLSKRDYDMMKLQEYRNKLKSTGPSAQFELKEAQKFQGLLQKYAFELPEEEWITWRDIQRKLGLLSKEELQIDMIAQLRAHLKDPNYKTSFQKLYLNRLTHLLEKVPVQLTPEEQERLLEIKVKFNALTPQDKDLLEYKKLQQKIINNQPLSKKEQKKYAEGAKTFKNQFSLNVDEEKQLQLGLQNYPKLGPQPPIISDIQPSQLLLNQSLALQSEQSAPIQDDPVVFRTLDDLMASKKRKMLETGTINASLDENGGIVEYSKDDMTQYSKAMGLVNKKRMKSQPPGAKKKGKKKKARKSKKQGGESSIMSKGLVHYDVDAEMPEQSYIQGQAQEASSLEESVDLSQEEDNQEEAPGNRRSLFELEVQRRASSKNPSPVQIITENIKERLETLQEIYTQDLKKELTPGVLRLHYQSSSVKEKSPVNRQLSTKPQNDKSLADQIPKQGNNLSMQPETQDQQLFVRGSANASSINQKPLSQETQALVQYESDEQGKDTNPELQNSQLPYKILNKSDPSALFAFLQNAQIVNRFQEDDRQFTPHQTDEQEEEFDNAQPIYRYVQGNSGSDLKKQRGLADPGNVPLISSGRLSATSGNGQGAQQTSWARRPAGYYRELSLKQITEAMASGGSSKSSIGEGRNSQPAFNIRDIQGSRETRAKSQERGNRKQFMDQRRKRMQTLGEDIKGVTATNQLGSRQSLNRRKIQSSADNRGFQKQPTNFILQQDNLMMREGENEEAGEKEGEEYDEEEAPTETIYTKDDKMQRVKVRRRRGDTNQKRKNIDYESPYAEYLLGAIKDPESGSKNADHLASRSKNPNQDSKFKKIKSIYNQNEVNPRAGRATSPITSARLMIHSIDNTAKPDLKLGGTAASLELPGATFGAGRFSQAPTDNQTSPDQLAQQLTTMTRTFAMNPFLQGSPE